MGSTYNAPVFNAAASGTQFTTPVTAEDDSTVSYVVEHPGPGTTTVYTHQVSNSSKEDVRLGFDKWIDDDGLTIPSKSAAEDFGVNTSPCDFRRSRMKMVTSIGSGVIKVSAFVKKG